MDAINDVFGTKVGVEENTAQSINFEMFPNPAADQLNVTVDLAEKSTVNLEIYSVDGRLVYQVPSGTFQGQTKFVIPTKEFNSGIYILKLSTGTEIVVRKFSKE
mgnify:FL=1